MNSTSMTEDKFESGKFYIMLASEAKQSEN